MIEKTDGSFAALIWTAEVQLKCGAANKFLSLPFNPTQAEGSWENCYCYRYGKIEKSYMIICRIIYLFHKKSNILRK